MDQFAIIKESARAWNQWRREFPGVEVDLSGTNLKGKDLRGINLSYANLIGTNFSGADLSGAYLDHANLKFSNISNAKLWSTSLHQADLTGAYFTKAKFVEANLSFANLSGADLQDVWFEYSDFSYADLSYSNLNGAFLQHTRLIGANFDQAILSNCWVFGISAWDIKGTPKEQRQLRITPGSEPKITVDDLQVAQFIYLLLNRDNLRKILDTITSKAVLLLGRFTPERKIILNALTDELRKYDLLPIIFDFEHSTSKDFTETIKTLAGLCLFIIADITNPKSVPLELQATVPDYQIPFVPILQEGEEPFSMFSDLIGKYNWMLQPVKYSTLDKLLAGFKPAILERAWQKHLELQKQKSAAIKILTIDEFLNKDELT